MRSSWLKEKCGNRNSRKLGTAFRLTAGFVLEDPDRIDAAGEVGELDRTNYQTKITITIITELTHEP